MAEEYLLFYHIRSELAHSYASLSVLLRLDDRVDTNTVAKFPLAPYGTGWVDHPQFRNVSARIQKVMERLFDPDQYQPHFFLRRSGRMTSIVIGWCLCLRYTRLSLRLGHFIMPPCVGSVVSWSS